MKFHAQLMSKKGEVLNAQTAVCMPTDLYSRKLIIFIHWWRPGDVVESSRLSNYYYCQESTFTFNVLVIYNYKISISLNPFPHVCSLPPFYLSDSCTCWAVVYLWQFLLLPQCWHRKRRPYILLDGAKLSHCFTFTLCTQQQGTCRLDRAQRDGGEMIE